MPELETSPEQPVLTVCGGRIKDLDRTPSAIYKGVRVYFCTPACLSSFHANPDGFMAGDVEHPDE